MQSIHVTVSTTTSCAVCIAFREIPLLSAGDRDAYTTGVTAIQDPLHALEVLLMKSLVRSGDGRN